MSSASSHYIANGVRGSWVVETKERHSDRAYLHVVTWVEFLPHLEELNKAGIDCLTLAQDYAKKVALDAEDGGDRACRFDTSWSDIAQHHPASTALIERLLKARGADLRRGDAIRLQFVGYRSYGTYFFDGTHVIPAESDGENCDYERIPSEFKVPTEFAIDYWDGATFVGYSQTGDYCFDVQLPHVKQVLSRKSSWHATSQVEAECIQWARVDIGRHTTEQWLVLCVTDTANECQDVVKRFLADGRCFGESKMENWFTTCPSLDEFYKHNNLIVDPKRTIVIQSDTV